MFEALSKFRGERGFSGAALKLAAQAATSAVGNVTSARAAIDAAMATFPAGIPDIDNADIRYALAEAQNVYQDLKVLRGRVDASLTMAVSDRPAGLDQEVLSFGSKALKTFDDTSVLLESRIRTLDQVLSGLIQVRTYAWNSRNNGGTASVSISGALSEKRALTDEERSFVNSYDAVTKSSWAAVGGLIKHESTSPSLKAMYAQGQSAYFKGSFAARREKLVKGLLAGPSTVFDIDDWQTTSNNALGNLAAVATYAMMNSTLRRRTLRTPPPSRPLQCQASFW
ncbi:hypothetical protein GCM10010924_49400 [Rhizobium wenxiniae]|uniref:Uncharacterized protein n=1 Tax=Rhizobium wenxiniae TaxID=1737357 RepID=A0A7W9YB46_9HYPH|nr:hypothetical protein [Rhizobium wenxiniae]MBB6165304.1 hypothetical protein [Rhizobium wenxiniae]GGG14377.1 hypothetical protein GCM10010924_49400 [Rhizobium wenxiniae]